MRVSAILQDLEYILNRTLLWCSTPTERTRIQEPSRYHPLTIIPSDPWSTLYLFQTQLCRIGGLVPRERFGRKGGREYSLLTGNRTRVPLKHRMWLQPRKFGFLLSRTHWQKKVMITTGVADPGWSDNVMELPVYRRAVGKVCVLMWSSWTLAFPFPDVTMSGQVSHPLRTVCLLEAQILRNEVQFSPLSQWGQQTRVVAESQGILWLEMGGDKILGPDAVTLAVYHPARPFVSSGRRRGPPGPRKSCFPKLRPKRCYSAFCLICFRQINGQYDSFLELLPNSPQVLQRWCSFLPWKGFEPV